MYLKYRKFLLILIVIFLASCDSGCIDSTDLGDSSEVDQLYVNATDNVCSYSSGYKYDNNIQSSDITKCLETSLVKHDVGVADNLLGYLKAKEYTVDDKDNGSTKISDYGYCNFYDNYSGSSGIDSRVEFSSNISDNTKISIVSDIFDRCVKYCTAKCISGHNLSVSSIRSTVNGWVKSYKKSNDNYYGITISNSSRIKVTASGKITLVGNEVGNELVYVDPNYGFDTNSSNGLISSYVPSGTSGKLSVKFNYNQSSEAGVDKYAELINELRRRYIKINEYNLDLEGYQNPDYSKLDCKYIKDPETNDVSYDIEMKYICNKSVDRNCKDGVYDSLNGNFSVEKLNLDVFLNDRFTKYSSEVFNRVKYDEKSEFILDPKYENDLYSLKKDSYEENVYELRYSFGNVSGVDGYILNIDSNDTKVQSFKFPIKGPNKIAFKSIDSNISNAKCSYELTMSDGKIYPFELLDNKWHTLKSNSYGKNEIVLNQFSDNVIVTLETKNKNCTKNLYIKLLPIKEFKVNRSGYAFFHLPKYKDSGKIKYSIINIDAKDIGDEENKYENFFELSDTVGDRAGSKSTEFYFKDINLLSDLNLLNNSNVQYYANNGFYIRKGQVLRLDYSNWLSIDNLNEITVKKWTTPDGIEVNYGLGLTLPIKDRPAYVCSGFRPEKIDNFPLICSVKGGAYKSECESAGKCKDLCIVNITEDYNDCNFKDLYNDTVKLYGYGLQDNDKKDFTEVFYLISSSFGLSGGSEIERKYSSEADIINKYIKKLRLCAKASKNSDKDIKFLDVVDEFYEKVICEEHRGNCKTENGREVCEVCIYDGDLKEIGGDLSKVERKTINDKIDDIAKILKVSKVKVDDGTENGIEMYKRSNAKATISVENNIEKNLLQCYDLEDYKGSFDYFNKVIKDCPESDASTIKTNGVTRCLNNGMGIKVTLGNLGVRKIGGFTTNSGGIPELFEDISENNSTIKTYEMPVSFDKNTYFNMLYLDDGFSLKTNRNSETRLHISSKEFNSNGKRIEIFLAKDSLIGKDLFDENGNIKEDDKIKWLVKCGSRNNCDNGLYKFDDSGKLVTTVSGSVGINPGLSIDSSDVETKNFLDTHKDDSDMVMYFKISDTDKDAANNNGSYKIKIVNTGNTTNYVSNIFEVLINEITSLMDGKSFGLAKDITGNSYMKCEEGSNVTCYYYNDTDVRDNGNKCKSGDNYCYASCDILSTEEEYKSRCEYVYNNGGFLKLIYTHIIMNPTYQFLLKLCLIAMLIFYGFGYFLGLSSFNQEELVKRMIRIAIVYTLVSPLGWNTYNKYVVKFFKQGVDSILYLVSSGFEVGNDNVIDTYLQRGDFTNKNILFSNGYDNIKLIFSEAIFNKILGLVFSGWYGPIYFYLVFSAVMSYCIAFITAIIMYVSAQVFISIILAIGPMIFMFLFFEKTKKTFDNWLDILISFSLQQIFIVLTLSFFNSLIYIVIKHVFAYTVCWNSILSLTLFGSPLSLLSFWKIPSGSTSGSTLNLQAAAENGPGFYNIMLFYIIGTLMGKFISSMADMAQEFSGGVKISDFSGNLTNKIKTAGDYAKNITKKSLTRPLDVVKNKIDGFNERAGKSYDEKYNERKNKPSNADNKDKKNNDVMFQGSVKEGTDDTKKSNSLNSGRSKTTTSQN